MKRFFSYKTPEEVGISSKAVLDFIEQLEDDGLNMHGFCMVRKSSIFAEGYWKPFTKDFQHRMYSVGKSFTAIAVGFLEAEGRVKLDDSICKYFPDKLPEEGVHLYIEKTTLRNMLTMQTPHQSTTFKRYGNQNDWVESFFRVEPTHHPGTFFSYDTSASHVLAALVERLSRKPLLDYLREKCLDKIQFSKESIYLQDPSGISQGGSGLICTLEDVAKVAYLCMHNGRYEKEQILPEAFIKEAIQKHVQTYLQGITNEQQGYGYQIWRIRHNGFAFYGMAGQLALCFPDEDLLIATCADTSFNPSGVQQIYDAVWRNFFPLQGKDDNEVYISLLNQRINSLTMKAMEGMKSTLFSEAISNKLYEITSDLYRIQRFSLRFEGDYGAFSFWEKGVCFQIDFKLGEVREVQVKESERSILATGIWLAKNQFCLQLHCIHNDMGVLHALFNFMGNHVTIVIKKTNDDIFQKYEGVVCGKKIKSFWE